MYNQKNSIMDKNMNKNIIAFISLTLSATSAFSTEAKEPLNFLREAHSVIRGAITQAPVKKQHSSKLEEFEAIVDLYAAAHITSAVEYGRKVLHQPDSDGVKFAEATFAVLRKAAIGATYTNFLTGKIPSAAMASTLQYFIKQGIIIQTGDKITLVSPGEKRVAATSKPQLTRKSETSPLERKTKRSKVKSTIVKKVPLVVYSDFVKDTAKSLFSETNEHLKEIGLFYNDSQTSYELKEILRDAETGKRTRSEVLHDFGQHDVPRLRKVIALLIEKRVIETRYIGTRTVLALTSTK